MQKLILHDDKEGIYGIENKIIIFIYYSIKIRSSDHENANHVVCIINKMCRKLFNYSLNDSFLIQIQIKLELYHRK